MSERGTYAYIIYDIGALPSICFSTLLARMNAERLYSTQ